MISTMFLSCIKFLFIFHQLHTCFSYTYILTHVKRSGPIQYASDSQGQLK